MIRCISCCSVTRLHTWHRDHGVISQNDPLVLSNQILISACKWNSRLTLTLAQKRESCSGKIRGPRAFREWRSMQIGANNCSRFERRCRVATPERSRPADFLRQNRQFGPQLLNRPPHLRVLTALSVLSRFHSADRLSRDPRVSHGRLYLLAAI